MLKKNLFNYQSAQNDFSVICSFIIKIKLQLVMEIKKVNSKIKTLKHEIQTIKKEIRTTKKEV